MKDDNTAEQHSLPWRLLTYGRLLLLTKKQEQQRTKTAPNIRHILQEKKLNKTISKYVNSVAFQEPPYTTTLELLSYLKEDTPDSLKYVLNDMFETITLYQNRVVENNSILNNRILSMNLYFKK